MQENYNKVPTLKKAAERTGGYCWPRHSRVMRLNQITQMFESVLMSTLALGDQVLACDPISQEITTEKIVFLYDHAKDVGPTGLLKVYTLHLSVQDKKIQYELSEGHMIPVHRVVQGKKKLMEVYAEELQLDDSVLVKLGNIYVESQLTHIASKFMCLKEMMIVWTPSMNIVVNNVVSSCNTASSAFLRGKPLLKYLVTKTILSMPDSAIYDSSSMIRRGLRSCGFQV